MPTTDKVLRLKRDPVAFISEVLIDPETKKPFKLYPAQVRFLGEGLTVKNGRLPYVELLFSAPKKSGKTTFAALMIYVIVATGGDYAEGYGLANDYEQAQGRVFQAITRIIAASPMLSHSAAVTANRIEFRATGAAFTR